MSSMINRPAGHPARRCFASLYLALALGLTAHLLTHTFVNPHRLTTVASADQSSAPSTAEGSPATGNPDSVSLLPSILATPAPIGLVVSIASPALIHICHHWPPPLHPPQSLATR
jgi:hypothetical protein